MIGDLVRYDYNYPDVVGIVLAETQGNRLKKLTSLFILTSTGVVYDVPVCMIKYVTKAKVLYKK